MQLHWLLSTFIRLCYIVLLMLLIVKVFEDVAIYGGLGIIFSMCMGTYLICCWVKRKGCMGEPNVARFAVGFEEVYRIVTLRI